VFNGAASVVAPCHDDPVTIQPKPGTVIDLPGAANCRDLGGWALTGGGTVRRGIVFRSTELNGLTDAGVDVITSLGIDTVFDLRTQSERSDAPDRLPDAINNVSLDVLADDPTSGAAMTGNMSQLMSDPKALEMQTKATPISQVMTETYRDIVNLASAINSYRSMYTAMAGSDQGPSLFHCTTGKDRTGWGASALLSFLGVAQDDIFEEYLLTNTEILPLTQPIYDTFAKAGGDPDLLKPLLGVDKAYLTAAFEEMSKRFGTIEDYFSKGLGLHDTTLDALRTKLIDTDS
jgi:protein-tyrosine phosphatase